MTYVLNNADVLPVLVVAQMKARRSAKPGVLQRLRAALVEGRMRSAARELRARNLLLNEAGMVMGGYSSASFSSDASLPFNR